MGREEWRKGRLEGSEERESSRVDREETEEERPQYKGGHEVRS